jgi:hypothetical protein
MDPHFMANTYDGFSGFTVFESDDQKEIASFVTQYTMSGVKIKIYPIYSMTDVPQPPTTK